MNWRRTPLAQVPMDLESDMKMVFQQNKLFHSSTRPNAGKLWSEEEIKKLLDGVSKGHSIETIAENHQRMAGAIRYRLKVMAADYYYNNELPIEKIQKFTGLSKEDIAESISRRAWQEEQKKNKPPKGPKVKPPQTPLTQAPETNDLKEVLEILKDIQTTLNDFVKGNYVKVKRKF